MSLFNVLSLIGGLALFLYGMNIMGSGLEKLGGGKLEKILERLTSNPIKGVLLGTLVTAIIQSSSATTVMVVGFVNSGIMRLSQAIGIIMGANVGTTATAWILSLSGIQGDSLFMQLLKPTNFTPILAMIGIIISMASKSNKKKNVASILLGFSVLMFGMDTMSSAVEPLKDVPEFTKILVMFENPILGVLAGCVLTAIIQSSSASVGILQALSATGAVTFGSAIPIILGQNIGTCITVILASIGANKNAKRAASVHLYFNIIGTIIFLSLFYIINAIVKFNFMGDSVTAVNIAIVHTCFTLLVTMIFLPFTKLLEKLAKLTIKDGKKDVDEFSVLDDRFFINPEYALDNTQTMAFNMAYIAQETLGLSIDCMKKLTDKNDEQVIQNETLLDRYEDELSKYLIRLSAKLTGVHQSRKVTMLLHSIGELEQITDYSKNLLFTARAKQDKNSIFSENAENEMKMLTSTETDIKNMTVKVFVNNDMTIAYKIEVMDEVIDMLSEELKKSHIRRMRDGKCTVETGIIFTDAVTSLAKVSYHCKNIAAFVIQMNDASYEMHSDAHRERRDSAEYKRMLKEYQQKYSLTSKK